MTPQKFSGPLLPDGEPTDLYVVGGRVTYEKQAGAETGAEGWIVPGLVDAHCHLGLDDFGATTDAETEQQAVDDRDGGALLIRDAGSAADTRWIQDRDDLPRLIRCGRHIGRTKRYIRNYAHEVEPDQLAAYAAQEARAGDGWIKLVGDWIDRDEGDLAPSFPAEAFAAAIAPSTPPRRARRSCASRSHACSAGRRTGCGCACRFSAAVSAPSFISSSRPWSASCL
jgi:imidazolonepropionase-like amidohydrolase